MNLLGREASPRSLSSLSLYFTLFSSAYGPAHISLAALTYSFIFPLLSLLFTLTLTPMALA